LSREQRLATLSGNIYEAQVSWHFKNWQYPNNIWQDQLQLFVNGNMMMLARWPNTPLVTGENGYPEFDPLNAVWATVPSGA